MAHGNHEVCERTPLWRRTAFVLFGAVLVTLALRLAAIDRPLLGNFATKNVVYAMIARNWAEGRSGFAYPMLDVLTVEGRSLHMLELPVSAYVSGGFWHCFGGSLDVWGRLTAVAFCGAAVGLLFLLVKRRHGTPAALGAATALAVSPVSIVYGQSFMLEASLVFFTVATFYAMDGWLVSRRWPWLAVAVSCFALLLLTKVYMLVLLLPLGAAAFARRCRDGGSNRRSCIALTLVALAVAVVPAFIWYYHAMIEVPSGPLAERVYYSVRQSVSDHAGTHQRLLAPTFWVHMLDDLTGVVLTPVGFALMLVGFLDRRWREYATWLVASTLLVLALPRKFDEMNYYWMAVLPLLAILIGLGWGVVYERIRPSRFAMGGLLAIVLVLSLRYAAKPAFVTPTEDRGVVAAGQAVQKLTAAEEPVVTMHGTTIDLLYYCNRPGWALSPDTPDLEDVLGECRRRGARYMVVAGRDSDKVARATRPLKRVIESDGFVVFELDPETPDNSL